MVTGKRYTYSLLGFVVCAGLPARPATAQNLVVNGSFELPDTTYAIFDASGATCCITLGTPLTGWTIANDGGAVQLAEDIPNAPDGNQRLVMDASTTNTRAIISQDLVTTPGETYTVRFAWSPQVNGSSTPTESITLRWGGIEVDTIEFAHNSNPPDPRPWTHAEYTVMATNSTTTLTFQNKGWPQPNPTSNRALMLDDVRVTVFVPEGSAVIIE